MTFICVGGNHVAKPLTPITEANMQLGRGVPPGQANSFIMLSRQISEEPENKFLFFQATTSVGAL
jgi:hypothetical protein